MPDKPWRDADTLRRLYLHRGMSQPEMADELGCSRACIRKWMDRHGIDTRPTGEGQSLWFQRQPDVTYDTTHHGYERVRHCYDHTRYQVRMHKLLAVAEYGFDAVCENDVHHKNHIPWDNRPENIGLMDPSDHSTHHCHVRHGNKPVPIPD